MKVIVVCGVHANETAAIEICKQLGKKKSFWTRLLRSRSHRLRLGKKKGEEYTDLSKLANRTITDKEVKFLDLSRYGSHAFAKWVHRVSLKKILEIYEKHIRETKRAPKKCKEFLREYVSLWRKYVLLWERTNKDWEAANIYQLQETNVLNGKTRLEKELDLIVDKYYLRGLFESEYVIPKEFESTFKNFERKYIDKPSTYGLNPLIKKELDESPNSFIIDLHCSEGNELKGCVLRRVDGKLSESNGKIVPVVCGTIWLPTPSNITSEKIEKEFRKVLFDVGLPFLDDGLFFGGSPEKYIVRSPEKYGVMGIEIPAPEGHSSTTYASTPVRPQTLFFSYLMKKCKYAKYGTYDIDAHITEVSERAKLFDIEFYKTGQFENSKKVIARLMRALLEWGEKWEAVAGK